MLSGIIEKISYWTGIAFSFLVLAMMAILGFEIVARYIFNSPTVHGPEWVPLLCGVYCVMGGAYTMLERGHVSVDLIYAKVSPKTQAIMTLITFPVGLAFIVALVYSSFWIALESVKVFEDSGTTAHSPVWLAKSMLPIGAFLLGVQWVGNIVSDCREAFTRK